jgi:hypothetical protein
MDDKKDKNPLRGIDPKKPFYMAVTIGCHNDGSIEIPECDDSLGAFGTESEAIDAAKIVNEEYPTLEGYVFYCVPVKRIWRGKVKVTSLNKSRKGK